MQSHSISILLNEIAHLEKEEGKCRETEFSSASENRQLADAGGIERSKREKSSGGTREFHGVKQPVFQ